MNTNSSSTPIKRFRIDPQSGTAFTIKQGQIIRIIDVEGEQVSDLFCFAKDGVEEHLSSGHTTDYNGKLFLSKGDTLYSNRSNPMFTIVADQVGLEKTYVLCALIGFMGIPIVLKLPERQVKE